MNDYYGYQPAADDAAGQANKRAFQANMIQSAFDTQQAMQMAEQAQKYEMETRQAMADIELANQKQLAADTFNYGMQKMASEFDMQEAFAGKMQGFDLEKMDRTGAINQAQTMVEGAENRLNLGEQGRQQRLNITDQATADVTKLEAAGKEERASIKTTGEENRAGTRTTGEETRKTVTATGDDQRKTLQEQTRLQAKDRTNQFQFANQLASR